MSAPSFTKQVIGRVENSTGPAPMNTFSAAGDVNGDGKVDIVLCGRNGKMVWLENSGGDSPWIEHLIDEVERMECGGSLVDLTGNGYLDAINGGDWRSDEVYWWENPGPVGGKWTKRLIARTGSTQIHDTIIGDVTGDGTKSLVFTNQHGPGGTTIYRIPLPQDPRQSPWPGIEAIARGKAEGKNNQPEEGLAIGDIDGDGRPELVCGTHWYKWSGSEWVGHKFASGYITTKVTIGDVDGDGKNEIVLSEGDPCVYGQDEGGKVGWFKPRSGDLTGLWEEHRIDEGLLDAHSLHLVDYCGNGYLDLLVGEVGVADHHTDGYVRRLPRLFVYENNGKGNFLNRHVIDEGTGTHEAVIIDADNSGSRDIFGKPLHGDEKWNVHIWRENRIR